MTFFENLKDSSSYYYYYCVNDVCMGVRMSKLWVKHLYPPSHIKSSKIISRKKGWMTELGMDRLVLCKVPAVCKRISICAYEVKASVVERGISTKKTNSKEGRDWK